MGDAMAVVMLAFVLGMYKNRRLNIAVFAGAALVFAGSLFLVPSQALKPSAARLPRWKR